MKFNGNAWKFGADVDTDAIIPARYLNTSDPKELAKHCMEDSTNPDFMKKMKPGDISGPIVTSSDGAVLSVLEKQAPSDQDFAAKRDQIRDSLLQSKQQELFGLFVANLRDRMEKSGKIKINQDEMKSLTRTQGGEEGE